MTARTQRLQGFTLVEILIVVVILGILAAIVIPQFSSASESAKASSLVSQLQTIRSQLELAQIQHQGAYPDLITDGWDTLTKQTEDDAAYTLGNGDGNEKGPYLQQAPANAFQPAAIATKVAADNSGGWKYNVTTGQIQAVLPKAIFAKADDYGLSASDVVEGN